MSRDPDIQESVMLPDDLKNYEERPDFRLFSTEEAEFGLWALLITLLVLEFTGAL